MRVSRALERLELGLRRRGVTSAAAALSTALSASAGQTAPIGLAATISTATLAAASAPTPVAIAASKIIAMTTLQKALVTVTIAIAVGFGAYEASQTSRLRGEVRTLQQQQAPLAEQLQQWQRERDEATNRLAALAEELANTKHNAAELLRLRAEVTQLRTDARVSAFSEPIEAAAKSWLERVKLLKRSLDQWPGRKAPELQLLSDQDWLNGTAKHDLQTDSDLREAMSELRIEAKKRFAGLAKQALGRFTQANNQQVPSALSQLLPFFESQADPSVLESILEDYQIAAPGTVQPPHPGPAEGEKAEVWAMVEKGEPADKEYDWHIVIYNGGPGSWTYGPARATK
jgi:hypothetical protein